MSYFLIDACHIVDEKLVETVTPDGVAILKKIKRVDLPGEGVIEAKHYRSSNPDDFEIRFYREIPSEPR